MAAQANLDQTQADFKRFKELRDQGFISSAELERRDAAFKAAQAQLDQAQGQLERAKAAGGLRADFAPTDLPLLHMMVGSVVEFYLEQWLDHSQTMRLSTVESLKSAGEWNAIAAQNNRVEFRVVPAA